MRIIKALLKHPTISAILGTVLGTLIVTPIIANEKSINFYEAFNLILNWVKNEIYMLLTFPVPLWNILVLILFGVVTIVLLRRINKGESEHRALSLTKDYKRDIINDILWLFEFYEGFDGNLLMTGEPHPICPKCLGELTNDNKTEDGYISMQAVRLVCEHCGFYKRFGNDFDEFLNKVKRELIRRIRTEEWKGFSERIGADKINT